jgi:hypothetical protein
MDATPAEARTFLHRILRWMAVLALAYGGLQAVSLIAFAAAQGFPYDRYSFGGGKLVSLGISILMVILAALAIVGGWGLLRWRAWARLVLVIWSALAILLGLGQGIVSTGAFLRMTAATSQPSGLPHPALVVWASLHHWLTNCVLPIVFLLILLQPEVARLWAGPRGGGGFNVIPMAAAATAAAARTEVAR